MQIALGSFSKKINSTKQPNLSTFTTYDVYLKDDCSLEQPIFIINGSLGSISTYDYCYVSAWSKFYYITDLVFETNNNIALHCDCDVLATYKSDIISTKAFVEYAYLNESNKGTFYNKLLPDKRISMTEKVAVSNNHTESIYTPGPSYHGTYILALAGRNLSAMVGGVNYYALSHGDLYRLAFILYQSSFIDDIKDYFDSPYSGIIECHWVPWNAIDVANLVTPTIGHKSLSDNSTVVYGTPLAGDVAPETKTYTIPIPWIYNDWRDFGDCSKYELFLPLYGNIEIDASILEGYASITVYVTFESISGEISYTVKSGNWRSTYRTDAKVPVAVGQTTGDAMGAISEIVGGTIALGAGIGAIAMSGGTMAPVVGGTLATVGGIASVGSGISTAFKDITTAKGGQGGFSRCQQAYTINELREIKLTHYAHVINMFPTDTFLNQTAGLPVMNTALLSNFDGYVKCSSASVDCKAHESDKQKINTYVNNGFYVE